MATYKSTQITNLTASPPVIADAGDSYGKVRMIRATYDSLGTEDVTAGETIELARLYSGATVIPFGKAIFEDFGTGVNISVGYAAYTDVDGDSVSADPDAFMVSTSISTAGAALLEATAGAGFFANPKMTATQEYISVIATFIDATGGASLLTASKNLDMWLAIIEE